jgi:hypothetical protein
LKFFNGVAGQPWASGKAGEMIDKRGGYRVGSGPAVGRRRTSLGVVAVQVINKMASSLHG